MVRIRASPTCRVSICPNSTSSTTKRRSSPTGPSAPSSSRKCPNWSTPTCPGCYMPTATKTFCCSPGCSASSTRRSTGTPGGTTTSISTGVTPPASSMSRHPQSLRRSCGALFAAAIILGALALPVCAADMSKTLRTAIITPETGFDPAATSDLYSDSISRAIFETLYSFDYLSRPYRRVPQTATAMPEITDGGRTWTMRVRPGIYFADDPAFKGRKRELVAADYVYSWKRLLDPRVRSPFAWYLQDKVVGAQPVIEAAQKSGRFDYDAPIEGLQALDRYTLRLKLKDPDFIMQGYLTQTPMAAVAREVIEAYGDANGWAMANPVGTGPYRLKSWRRGAQIVLEANPNYRDETFPASDDPADRDLVAKMRGKKLPIVGRIEIDVIEE